MIFDENTDNNLLELNLNRRYYSKEFRNKLYKSQYEIATKYSYTYAEYNRTEPSYVDEFNWDNYKSERIPYNNMQVNFSYNDLIMKAPKNEYEDCRYQEIDIKLEDANLAFLNFSSTSRKGFQEHDKAEVKNAANRGDIFEMFIRLIRNIRHDIDDILLKQTGILVDIKGVKYNGPENLIIKVIFEHVKWLKALERSRLY